jgi:hypothetical protein
MPKAIGVACALATCAETARRQAFEANQIE